MNIFVEPKVLKEPEFMAENLQSLQTWNSDEELEKLHEVVDFVVSLGGDGTILWTSSLFKTSGELIKILHVEYEMDGLACCMLQPFLTLVLTS